MASIRACRHDDIAAILAIINAAAAAYRGVIPPDRWHEPYMDAPELDREIGAGVRFWGYEADGALVGVMGIQPVQDVDLIRHAYVLPQSQGRGIGAALLAHLRTLGSRRMLIGTWAAADWAIRFYVRNGFEQVSPERTTQLLQCYWDIPERQVETSVVLAAPPFEDRHRIIVGDGTLAGVPAIRKLEYEPASRADTGGVDLDGLHDALGLRDESWCGIGE